MRRWGASRAGSFVAVGCGALLSRDAFSACGALLGAEFTLHLSETLVGGRRGPEVSRSSAKKEVVIFDLGAETEIRL